MIFFLTGEKYQEKSTHLGDLNRISEKMVILCRLDNRNSEVQKPQSSSVSENAMVDMQALKPTSDSTWFISGEERMC